ncbi:MAG: rod shape-determining protein MreD [Frankiaceae bacterium]|nr:rod shape-determining protein MreD [Frankiaceae bacterium]
MTTRRFLLAAAAVLTALLLQDTALTQLPLPGAAPDLLLVLVVAYALVEGPLSGMTTGFVAGLLADSLADHALGRLALAYAVVGYATGFIEDDTDRSTLLPFVAVAAGAVGAVLLFAGVGMLLGDPRVTLHAVGRSLASSVPYSVVLTPFVVPVLGALVRRIEPDPIRR